jgi:two-component system, NarL family, response regulator
MTSADPIRILLADDHPVVRQGLAALINRQPGMRVVAEATTGREAVALFAEQRPDITLMDLRMPELDGVAAILAIRAETPSARVIILTTYDGDEEIYRGLLAGAMAYLLKDATPEVLVEAIQAVHAGQKRIPQEVAAKLAERMGGPELTPRELEVLRLLVAGHSNKGIGAVLAIGEGTVRTHVANILAKLQVQDRTQAATAAIRRGIVHLD